LRASILDGAGLSTHAETRKYMQGDFDFDCEGKGEWRGEPSWLVHFRQRPDRTNHMHGYSLGDKFYRIDLKGRAWISIDTSQIVRMEDMVNPMREIQLLSEHQTVEYGPVPFAKKKYFPLVAEKCGGFTSTSENIVITWHHIFDHYLLFDVDAQGKTKASHSAATNDTPPKDEVSH
jgi:hypothetical protein